MDEVYYMPIYIYMLDHNILNKLGENGVGLKVKSIEAAHVNNEGRNRIFFSPYIREQRHTSW